MPTIARARLCLILAAAATALAACGSPPPPAPPPVVEAPPPPPPILPPPPIAPPKALAASIIEDASAFRAYMNSASAITPDFKDAAQVAAGVRVATAFEQ